MPKVVIINFPCRPIWFYATDIRDLFPWDVGGCMFYVMLPAWTFSCIFNPSLTNQLLSAKFIFCFNFQSASMSLKVGENVDWVSKSLDPDETPRSRSKLGAYGTLIVIGGLWVKVCLSVFLYTCTINIWSELTTVPSKNSWTIVKLTQL